MNIRKIGHYILRTAKKHSPEILMAVGIISVVGGTVAAVTATPKALDDIAADREEKADVLDMSYNEAELTPYETVRACWKNYIPTIVLETCGVACLIGSHIVGHRRQIVLATACTTAEEALAMYQKTTLEEVGEKTEAKIRSKIAEKEIQKNPVPDYIPTQKQCQPVNEETNYQRFVDTLSQRYFYSTMETVKRTMMRLDNELFQENHLSVNDYYISLGLEPIKGDCRGWAAYDSDHMLDYEIRPVSTPDGLGSVFAIEHYVMPTADWDSLW